MENIHIVLVEKDRWQPCFSLRADRGMGRLYLTNSVKCWQLFEINECANDFTTSWTKNPHYSNLEYLGFDRTMVDDMMTDAFTEAGFSAAV